MTNPTKCSRWFLRPLTFLVALAASNAAFANVRAFASAPKSASDVEARVPPLHGTLELKSMPMSPLLKRKITTWVYLPPGYDDAANAQTRYPTIYLLHGQPGAWTDCFLSGHVEETADALINKREMAPTILVAFDGNGPGGAHDMTNFCDRSDDYAIETFIASELVPYIDGAYRTRPVAAQRALWGYSGGGFGALNIGLPILQRENFPAATAWLLATA